MVADKMMAVNLTFSERLDKEDHCSVLKKKES